jgi:hypothetical protein
MSKPTADANQSLPTTQDEERASEPAPTLAPLPGTPLAQESSGASDVTVIKVERGGGDVSPCTQPYDERMEDVEEEREPLTATRLSMDVDREQMPGQQLPHFSMTPRNQPDSLCFEPEPLEKESDATAGPYFSLGPADENKSLGYLAHGEQEHHDASAFASLFTTATPFSTPYSATQLTPATSTSGPYMHMNTSAFEQQTPLMGLGVHSLPPTMSMMMPHGGSFSFPLTSPSQFSSAGVLAPSFATHGDCMPQPLQRMGSDDGHGYSMSMSMSMARSMSMAASMGGGGENVLAMTADGREDEIAGDVVSASSSSLDSLHGFTSMI